MFFFLSVRDAVLCDAAQTLKQEQREGRDPGSTLQGQTEGRTAALLMDISIPNHKEVPDKNDACASCTAKVPFFPLHGCTLICI